MTKLRYYKLQEFSYELSKMSDELVIAYWELHNIPNNFCIGQRKYLDVRQEMMKRNLLPANHESRFNNEQVSINLITFFNKRFKIT